MTMTRVAMVAGILIVAALLTLFAIAVRGAATPVVILVALAALIGGGNLLYGKNSHGAAAQARVRPAQEARNRAIDEARLRAAEQSAPAAPAQSAPESPAPPPTEPTAT